MKGFLNGQRQIAASVNKSSDAVDFYEFKVETPSNFNASISVEGGSSNMGFFLAKDFNNRGLELTYDTLTQKITGEGFVAREGDLVTVEGDGNGGERVRIQFRANFSTLTT